MRLLLDRLDLKPGDRLLEIGSGWGYLAENAARQYGAQVTSITLSEEQLAHARARVERAGLADRVTFSLTDYRDVAGRFDASVRVGQGEAVGRQKWAGLLGAVACQLGPGGKAAGQCTLDAGHGTTR